MKFIKPPITRLLFLFFLSSFAGCSGRRSDKEIQQSINIQLSGNENYKDVNATVNKGIVKLTGECKGENCVTEIEKIVKGNKYDDSVINQLHQKSTGANVSLDSSLQKIISNYPGVKAEISDSIIILTGSITRVRLPRLMNEVSSLYNNKIDDRLVVKVN
jgi:hyperosmotically inducible protein